MSFGETNGLHSVTFSGNNVRILGVNRDSHVSISGMTFTALMDVQNIGKWSISCHNNDHFEAGMKAMYTTDNCGEQNESFHRVSGVTRTYYIAAVERQWDYSPLTINPVTGEDYSIPGAPGYQRVARNGQFLGSVYKKALYREFTDANFEEELPVTEETRHLGMLGPIIRANVGDVIKVVFKNMATRGYSIHPHGLQYSKSDGGMKYGANESTIDQISDGSGIPPGTTFTYTWNVPESSGPAPNGPNCVSYVYHSAVDVVRDTHSGLVGPIIICKPGVIGADGRRHDSVEREFVLLFQAFNENRSWYLDDNIKENGPVIDTLSTAFEESNMYDAVDGLIFNNVQGLVMNKGENIVWYLCGLGGNEDIHTVHFHGQSVIHRSNRARLADVIEVFPGTSEVAEMFAENPGNWQIHCHVGEHTLDGMTALFSIK